MRGAAEYYVILVFLLTCVCSCKKEYSYEGGPSSTGWLVKDLNNDCSLITVGGRYRSGKKLADTNFLQVLVYVTRAGAYNITSNQMNGYSFAGTGNFHDTGLVSVKLAANGTPMNAGTDLFKLQFDSSICEVPIVVLDSLDNTVSITNPDHFPLAEGNRWSYDDLSYPGDSIVRTISGTATWNSSTYYVMDDYISFYPATNQNYYQKIGDDYLAYVAVSTYTSALDYSPSLYDDLVFLKENSRTGDQWYSNTYTGTTSFGYQVLVLRYHFRCLAGDATVTINGKTFLHVCKMQMLPEVADVGASLKPTGEIHTAYYAKGVGLIYREFFNGIRTHPELQIRSWVIH